MSGGSPGKTRSVRLGRPRDWIIGGLLLLALVLAVSLSVGWGPLLAPWRSLSMVELATLLALSALSYLLRAVRVYDYFRPSFDGRIAAVLRLSVLHNTANNLLPMRAGEMVFPWLMRRYFAHGFVDATAALVWIRLLDLHFLGLIGIFTLYLREPSWLWPSAGLLWLGLLPLAGLVRNLMPAGGDGRLRKILRLLTDAAPGSGGRVLRIYLWTALSWSTKFIAFATLLHHFLPVDLWLVLIGVMGAELSSVLPFHGIAGSGSYELAAVAALVPLGVSAEKALAGAVNLHLFLLGVTLLLGVLALLLPVRRSG
ncbi:MAG: lysylphosphatidylglycerol synthase transmembrane domain-containing protein [Pseudomonadota bacterium]|nr:lysylphosphatidylglycerol synthase transmembrane domain-containing protein [Pseudomonadota bacterium]